MSIAGKVGLELAQKLLASRVSGGGFDKHLDKVKITEVGGGILTAEMKVEMEHCNLRKTLHGGMSALLVDVISGIALLTAKPSLQHAGASVNINMTYLKGVQLGQEILIKAKTNKVGSKLAFLSVDILNKSSNELLATGYHVKYIEQTITGKPS